MNRPPHALIGGYMKRKQLPPAMLSADGGLSLRVNGQYRVRLHPARADSLVFEGLLARLPTDRLERERLVDHALRLACARLQDRASGLAVDRYGESLRLQRCYTEGAGTMTLDEADRAIVIGTSDS